MNITPTKAYAVKDYVFATIFALTPLIFNFNSWDARSWVPIALGGGAIVYSLITDYELSAIRLLSMPVHLMLDLGGGLLLALSPWIFGFADEVYLPHLVLGCLEIGVVLASAAYGKWGGGAQKKEVYINPNLRQGEYAMA